MLARSGRECEKEDWAREVHRVAALRAAGTVYLARKREERLRRQAAEAAASISLPAASMSEAGVLQAQAEVGREGGALSPALSGRIGAKRGGGQPLEATVRRGMEGVFGVDFSPVRIHADPEADTLNRGVAAVAFTVGSDIFFRAGFYQPRTPAGQHLLAHELTHVVQQRAGSLGTGGGGNAGGGTMTVSAADDRHEQEAEQTAHRVVAALQARGPALSAPATSPGAALSRVHDPAVALAPAAPGIARAAAPSSWPAPPTNKTGLVPLAVPCPGAIVAGNGTSLPLAAPVLAAARVIPQPLPVGAPVLLLGHDGAGGSDWSYVRLVAQPWAGREGWLSSAMVKLAPAPPRSVAPRRVPAPAVVFNDGGVHLYAQPSTAQTQAPLLPWNTTLTVDAYLPPDAAHKDQAGWCHVTTPAGQRGYVNSGYLDYDLPDPQAKLLKIQAHDTAEIIVKKAGYHIAHGRDARYYVNVLVSVNKPGTLYNPDPHPEQTDHWKKTIAVKDETIWLPGQAFADSLTGVVGSGSITGGAWAALQQGLGWAEVHVLQTAALASQALGIVGDAATNAAHYALTVGGQVIARIPRAVGPAAVAALQAVATLGTQPAALIVALGKAVAGAVLHQLPPQLVALLEQKAQEVIMGVLGPDVRRVLGDARATLALILANPVAFLTHLGGGPRARLRAVPRPPVAGPAERGGDVAGATAGPGRTRRDRLHPGRDRPALAGARRPRADLRRLPPPGGGPVKRGEGGVVRGQQRGEDGDDHEEEHDERPYHGQLVAPQAAPHPAPHAAVEFDDLLAAAVDPDERGGELLIHQSGLRVLYLYLYIRRASDQRHLSSPGRGRVYRRVCQARAMGSPG